MKVKIELIYKQQKKTASIKFRGFDAQLMVDIVNKIIQYLMERFSDPLELVGAGMQCNISWNKKTA